MSKHSPGPFDEILETLRADLKDESTNTMRPGNPFISAMAAKIGGMESVLSYPLYSAAPEMLCQLENAATLLQWFFDDPKKFEANAHLTLTELREQIAKARGGK